MSGSWIEIDRDRLLANVAVFRKRLGPACRLMAVVKGDAYGHGADLVVPVIRDAVDWLGVDSVSEARSAPMAESGRPILVLGHTPPDAAETLVARGIRQVLFRRDVAERLATAASEIGKPAYVHLKIETGLHRLGVPMEELDDFTRFLASLDGLVVEGVYTHFADVESPASSFYQEQLTSLRESLTILRGRGIVPTYVHAAPTAGALLHEPGELTLARVGVGLYGIWPSPETRAAARELELKPVLSWKCRIAQVKSVPKDASVGYDRTFRAPSERRIAVIPVGYYDGLDRKLSSRGEVLVRGQRAPIVGRVAMNMTMIDVTATGAEDDDEVVLIGEQGDQTILAEDVAAWSDTIAYEVVSKLRAGLDRRIG